MTRPDHYVKAALAALAALFGVFLLLWSLWRWGRSAAAWEVRLERWER